MAAHTPTPWCVLSEDIWSGDLENPGVTLYRTDRGQHRRWGRSLSDEERDANAALIVEAVNSHADLVARVAALEAALQDISAPDEVAMTVMSGPAIRGWAYAAASCARAALAKDGGS